MLNGFIKCLKSSLQQTIKQLILVKIYGAACVVAVKMAVQTCVRRLA